MLWRRGKENNHFQTSCAIAFNGFVLDLSAKRRQLNLVPVSLSTTWYKRRCTITTLMQYKCKRAVSSLVCFFVFFFFQVKCNDLLFAYKLVFFDYALIRGRSGWWGAKFYRIPPHSYFWFLIKSATHLQCFSSFKWTWRKKRQTWLTRIYAWCYFKCKK